MEFFKVFYSRVLLGFRVAWADFKLEETQYIMIWSERVLAVAKLAMFFLAQVCFLTH